MTTALGCLALIAGTAPGVLAAMPGEPTGDPGTTALLRMQIESLLEAEAADEVAPFAQILVSRDGVSAIHMARGGAMGGEPIYRIASITKVVTALAVLKAVESGLVDLDQDIRSLFPELSRILDSSMCRVDEDLDSCGREVVAPITVMHLLTHTDWSGLFFTNLSVFPDCGVSAVFVSRVRPDQRGTLARKIGETLAGYVEQVCRPNRPHQQESTRQLRGRRLGTP